MRLSHPIFSCGLLLIALSSYLPAQVLSHGRRVDLLDRAQEHIVAPVDNASSRIADANSPFFPKKDVSVEVQSDAEAAALQPVVKAPKLSDEVLLNLIATNFKPTGSLVAGERRMLVLQGGGSLTLGSVFSARVNNQVHPVEITEITSSGYTLRLRNVSLSQSFSGSGEGITSQP